MVTIVTPSPTNVPATGLCVIVAVPQLFELKASVKSGIAAKQFSSALKVTGAGQSNIGSMLSSIVTVAVHVELFPASSVIVKTTSFAPKSSQVNSVTSTDILANPQLSNEPLLISSALIRIVPVRSNCKLISLQTTVGGIVSLTSSSTSQRVSLPAKSVAITVTVKSLLIVVPASTLCITTGALQLSSAVTIATKSGTVTLQSASLYNI